MNYIKKRHFYGSTTIGERGQAVIPAEAREALNLEKGEKLLVFGMEHEALVLAKLSSFKRLAQELEKHQREINNFLKKS